MRFTKGVLKAGPNHPPIINWRNSILELHSDRNIEDTLIVASKSLWSIPTRQKFHECEVRCPNEARAAIIRVVFLEIFRVQHPSWQLQILTLGSAPTPATCSGAGLSTQWIVPPDSWPTPQILQVNPISLYFSIYSYLSNYSMFGFLLQEPTI